MNLVEPMVASLLFMGAATGSLQLQLLATAADAADERLQAALDRAEAELQAAELLLRRRALAGDDRGRPCHEVVRLWAALLADQAAAEGLTRSQEVEAASDPPRLRLRVAAAGLPTPRERHYSPAAYAACALEASDASA
jgi:hypothetical protein